GNAEFCEGFLDDVVLPDDAVVGEVNQGWTVASRQLLHERRAMGGGSEYASGIDEFPDSNRNIDFVALARRSSRSNDPLARAGRGRALVQWTVHDQLIPHVTAKIAGGELPDAAGSIIRLFVAETEHLANDVGV